jgi:hypothetical protein
LGSSRNWTRAPGNTVQASASRYGLGSGQYLHQQPPASSKGKLRTDIQNKAVAEANAIGMSWWAVEFPGNQNWPQQWCQHNLDSVDQLIMIVLLAYLSSRLGYEDACT